MRLRTDYLRPSIWIQKAVVLLLYRRMLHGLPWPNHIMNYYWVFLGVTYVVAQTVTFVECHPFYLYWQVVPDPGMNNTYLVWMVEFNMSNRHMPSSSRTINHLCCPQYRH
jgi:hypothetical protein